MKKVTDDDGRDATYSLLSVYLMRMLQLLMVVSAANFSLIIYFCSLGDQWKCTYFDHSLTKIDFFKDPCCSEDGNY